MQNIRKTLYDIWNSEENSAVTGVVEETASTEEDSTEAEFAEAELAETDLTQAKESFRKDENASTEVLTGIKTPDINSPDYVEQIRTYLDESKEIHYVKNSDLLTYYDRSGKIVKMNGADKKRILKGDGSELKG